MGTQIGPATNGIRFYDVTNQGNELLGHLLTTGAAPGHALPSFGAAWCWVGQRTEFPESFQLRVRPVPPVLPDLDGAWKYREHPFPTSPDVVDPTGFTAHLVSRSWGGPVIGHLFNRGREQFWASWADQLDGGRCLRDRDRLTFARVYSAAPGPERAITTLS